MNGMIQISFAKGFLNDSQLDGDEFLSVALAITDNALSHWSIKAHLDNVGKRFEKVYINYCDIDRIYLSLDAEASPDSYADFIIRTWDYHISEENPSALSIDWTFHCMGESSSAEHCDGSHDILIFGNYDGLNEDVTNNDQLARLEAAAHSGDGGLANRPSQWMHCQRATRWYIKWFQAMCDNPDLCGIDELDDEMRILTVVKNYFKDVVDQFGGILRSEILDFIKEYVSTKFRQEWYKNYCKELYEVSWRTFDVDFVGFTDYLLEVGHTERQDKITCFMRDYPMEILTWLDDAIPEFYRGLAKGNDYELVGLSKEEFIQECGDEMDYRYAYVLEDKYGAAYAAEYIKETEAFWFDFDYAFIDLLEELASKCENENILRQLMVYYKAEDVDKSIKYASRLARLWIEGMISDEWISDDVAMIFENYDYNQCIADGDMFQDENPEGMMFPYEEGREWLLKLLNSDFSNSIADILSPFLKNALDNIRKYNNRLPDTIAPWSEGVQAIEAFLNR